MTTTPFGRGSAPGRARSAEQRTGSFEKGHKKLGGRQKGTPNRIAPSLRQALLEAANRVGRDGQGTDGLEGYLRWVARQHPKVALQVADRLMQIEEAEVQTHQPSPSREALRPSKSDEPSTITPKSLSGGTLGGYQEISDVLGGEVERAPETSNRRRRGTGRLPRPSVNDAFAAIITQALSGGPIDDQEHLVVALANLAVTAPAKFCKMLAASFLVPPRKLGRAQTRPTFEKRESMIENSCESA